MKYISILFILSITLFSCAKEESFIIDGDNTEALTGFWTGTLTANNWIGHFDFAMDLDENRGSIEGTSTISFPDLSRGEATMLLKGDLVRSSFTFEELSILQHTGEQESFGWCIKTGLLTYEVVNGIGTLRGSWTDPSQCRNSGEINLSKTN